MTLYLSSMPQSSSQTENDGMIMGLVGQRRQLVNEIAQHQQQKLAIAMQLKNASGEELKVLRQTLSELDQSLQGARTALRGIDNAIAARQGAPVIAGQPPQPPQAPQGEAVIIQPQSLLPPQDISPVPLYLSAGALALVAITLVAGLSYARRLRRDTAAALERFYGEMRGEMHKLTNGVEAMSVELERIGEGQRFVTKALVEKKEVV